MHEHEDTLGREVYKEIEWSKVSQHASQLYSKSDSNLMQGLDATFKANAATDPEIKWQYFGSDTGFFYNYPAMNWPKDVAGMPENYDPRHAS